MQIPEKYKDRKIHGVFSIMLLDTACLVALIAVFFYDEIQGFIYLLCYIVGIATIIFSYCGKCPCGRDSCAHIVPGLLATIMPKRSPGRYTGMDYLGVAIPVTILLIFPQVALLHYGWPIYLYWTMVIIGAADIYYFACPGCGNEYCPMHKRGKGNNSELT